MTPHAGDGADAARAALDDFLDRLARLVADALAGPGPDDHSVGLPVPPGPAAPPSP